MRPQSRVLTMASLDSRGPGVHSCGRAGQVYEDAISSQPSELPLQECGKTLLLSLGKPAEKMNHNRKEGILLVYD